jgi:DNA-binding beta-propeller fold protein YncE
VTGLCADGNTLYLSSRNQNRAYKYTLPGITSRLAYTFYTGAGTTCDIAYDPVNKYIWVASESTSIPIRCYDESNTMVDYILPDFIPNARGMALDPSGHLWVSDILNDKIYQVDLFSSIEEEGTAGVDFGVTASANPFSGPLTIEAPGISATVTVFDMYGRQILEQSFQESWTWNSVEPAGSYHFVITDGNGSYEALNLIKI